MYSEKDLVRYLRFVVDDYANDFNRVRFLRRLHIKQVHLKRRGGVPRTLIEVRRLF